MQQIEFRVKSKTGRDFLADVTMNEKRDRMPVVVFCHGFKGFKDWGPWDLVAKEFAKEGFCFVKFNFSHNGIGLKDPQKFTLLNEFSENTISKEMLDLESVLEFVLKSEELQGKINPNEINLIGHSRGAATAFLSAAVSKKLHKIAGWAGVYDLKGYCDKFDLEDWKEKGSLSFVNARTNQEMKVGYAFAEEIYENRYAPSVYLPKIEIPMLLIHGEDDETVPCLESELVYNNILHAIYIPMEGANHTFGSVHPSNGELSEDMKMVVENTTEFFKD